MNIKLLKPDNFNSHLLLCKKAKGGFEEGKKTDCKIQPMGGKQYKPGKDKEGKWLDVVGKPETRLMVFSGNAHVVFQNEKELNEYFDEVAV